MLLFRPGLWGKCMVQTFVMRSCNHPKKEWQKGCGAPFFGFQELCLLSGLKWPNIYFMTEFWKMPTVTDLGKAGCPVSRNHDNAQRHDQWSLLLPLLLPFYLIFSLNWYYIVSQFSRENMSTSYSQQQKIFSHKSKHTLVSLYSISIHIVNFTWSIII